MAVIEVKHISKTFKVKLKEKGLKVFKVSKDIPPEEQQKVMAAVFEGRKAAGKFLYKKS